LFCILRTNFCDLSNEIFYEIFEFLDFCDIYEGFFNLNHRFQSLLINLTLPIRIKLSSISKSTFEHYYTEIIIPYQDQIESLHLTNPFITEILFSSNSIKLELVRLERLILDKITSDYLEELLNHLITFPCLSSLVIICGDFVSNSSNLYRQIFRLITLKYCNLSWKSRGGSRLLLPFASTELSPIEHLILKTECQVNDLNAILSYLPQLHRLSVSCFASSTDRKMRSCSTISNCLTHASLDLERVNLIEFSIFESIIENVFEQLEVLHISIKHDSLYFNSDRWKQLILSYMPHLRVFDFLIYISSCSDGDIQRYIAEIDQFNSPFWFERKWFFQYHIENNNFTFFSTNPYR
jgi:hypothetical protein